MVEKAYISKQQAKILLWVNFAAVNVYNIRDQLEGIKRNANGQCNLWNYLRNANQLVECGGKKAGIFKDTKKSQTDN